MAEEPPLHGIQVLEFSTMVAVPAGAGILSDWGADVIRVEAPGGDKLRHVVKLTAGQDLPHPPFEGDNRGKRSVVLDAKSSEGHEAMNRLLANADVFVSNFRVAALESLGLGPEKLLRNYPSLVVALISAYGREGLDKDKPGYDIAAFWARSGLAMNAVPEGEAPRVPSNGVGDRITGVTLAGGICAALLRRSRTGRGCIVETSLFHTGIYANGGRTSIALASGSNGFYPHPLAASSNPLFQTYAVAGGDFIEMLGLESQRHLSAVAAALQLPELLTSEFFNTAAARNKHKDACHALIRRALLGRTLAEWRPIFERHSVWFDAHQRVCDAINDPQAIANDFFVDLEGGARTYNTPVSFSDAGAKLPTWPRVPAPQAGQHTEEVLGKKGLGTTDSAVAELSSKRAVADTSSKL